MGATSCQNVTAPVAVGVPPPPPHAATPRVNPNTTEITPIRTMRELLVLSSVETMGRRGARPRCLKNTGALRMCHPRLEQPSAPVRFQYCSLAFSQAYLII